MEDVPNILYRASWLNKANKDWEDWIDKVSHVSAQNAIIMLEDATRSFVVQPKREDIVVREYHLQVGL